MHLPDHIAVREVALSSAVNTNGVLSDAELNRMATFRHAGRRRSFALGRYVARTLLADRLGCAPRDVPLDVRDDGSVGVVGDAYHLSITHSHEYAAAGIAPHDLGVDLESIRPRPASLFRFMLHPDEMSLIDRVDLPEELQIVLFWSLKEAVLKGKRTGLRRSPKSLRLDIDLDRRRATVRGQRRWEVRFDIRTDHVLTVAWPTEAYSGG